MTNEHDKSSVPTHTVLANLTRSDHMSNGPTESIARQTNSLQENEETVWTLEPQTLNPLQLHETITEEVVEMPIS